MKKLRIEYAIILIIVSILSLATGLTLLEVWLGGSRMTEATVVRLFSEVEARTEEHTHTLLAEALEQAELAASAPDAVAAITGNGGGHRMLPLLRKVLELNPSLYSIYMGKPDGSFLQVIAVNGHDDIRTAHNAPDGTVQILRTITRSQGKRVQSWTFFDQAGAVRGQRSEDASAYDPRQRPWYAQGLTTDSAALSEPYVFDSLQRPGITASRALAGRQGVLGVDITLDAIGAFVSGQTVSPGGALVLLDDDGRLLAAPPAVRGDLAPLSALAIDDKAHPILALVAKLRGSGDAVPVTTLRQNGRDYVAQLSRWRLAGHGFIICVVAPFDDFTGPVRRLGGWIMLLSLGVMVIAVPLTVVAARMMARTIRELADDAEHIREMDFSGTPSTHSIIAEFHTLAEVFTLMKRTLLSRTRDLETSQAKLRRQLELGMLMNAQSNIGKLVENILLESRRLAHAEGGTLYLRTKDDQLRFQYIHNESLDIAIGGNDADEMDLPTVPLWDEAGKPILSQVAAAAIHSEKTIAIADVRACTDYDFSGIADFDQRTGYRTVSMLVVPLKPRGGPVIGAIQLINAHEEGKPAIIPFRLATQRFIEGLAAQASIALHNRTLLADQEALVNSMVRIVSSAIDAKSPYTADHSSRVASLSLLLAEEATKAEDGPLAEFRLTTPDEWHELEIAAWLHDCGKVTTPEFVVDKATKLETIHNRIHEIRTRFEVLLRDAEIDRLRAVAAGADVAAADAAFAARQQQLQDDFAFIAECNIGSEFMAPAKVERVKKIAANTWLRHFDDHLGLSMEESRRLAGLPKAALPATEALLADRPEHLIPWSGSEKFHGDQWAFVTQPPANMYDRGEIHNLSIPRGTLTPEERFKINEHVIQTTIMLEHLPFPRHLRHVPEYACAHHEALDGKGYPRGLTGKDMSVPARIIAVADIFEALTSADRPYKKAKPLSEAIDILAGFRDRNHLDPDLFDLLLRSGLYRRYAEAHLRSDQLDAVDVDQYLLKEPVL